MTKVKNELCAGCQAKLDRQRLSAAAPELLDALAALVAVYGKDHPLPEWRKARTVIKKAEGKS